MTARAVMISQVTASGSGTCDVILFVLSYCFTNFAQVTAGVGVCLRSLYQL